MAIALAEQRERLDHNAAELEVRLAGRTLELEKARAIAVNQERFAAMGVLAAGVAHEIGNPLTAISAIVQRLDPETGLGEKREVLTESLDRIQGILRTLVDCARPPANEWRLVSLNETVRRTAALVLLDPRAKDVELTLSLDPELPRVHSVEDKLRQVFLNLLLNALDALGPGGGVVEVKTAVTGGRAEVSVGDSGPGIPPELRARILEPFFTTKEHSGGTGLGLAVSLSLLEELGGELTVGEAPSGGALFVVSLPLDAPQESS